MNLLIGLGNPGDKYKNNRHNVGHMFVDFLRTKNGKLKVLKTDCFMNVSGKFVKKCLSDNRQLTAENLYLVHDDLDIPFGKTKVQFGTGPKLHNGILSIEEELGTADFWRVRIGVDNRGEDKVDGETYSLEDFTAEELKTLQPLFEKLYKQMQTQKII